MAEYSFHSDVKNIKKHFKDNIDSMTAQKIATSICYCRILRKFVKHEYRYYIQVVFKGIPPVKVNTETGEIKHTVGNGEVGLDIGTSTIAIASESDVKILELADKVQNIENEKRKLQRKMDRSRRATNPNNYNLDGTIKLINRL